MSRVSTGHLKQRLKAAKGTNCLASPSSLTLCARPTVNCSSLLWVETAVFFWHYNSNNVQPDLSMNVLWFLQGYNQWNNELVEQWNGSQSRQSYSHLIHSNSSVSFTWSFQRTSTYTTVRQMGGVCWGVLPLLCSMIFQDVAIRYLLGQSLRYVAVKPFVTLFLTISENIPESEIICAKKKKN